MLLMTSSLPNHLSAPASARHLSGSNSTGSADALAFAEMRPAHRESDRSLDFHALLSKPDRTKGRSASRETARSEPSARPAGSSRVQPDQQAHERTALDEAEESNEQNVSREPSAGQLEQAAAFVAALMQVWQPDEAAAPAAGLQPSVPDEQAPLALADDSPAFPSPGGVTDPLPGDSMLPAAAAEPAKAGRAEAEFFLGEDGVIECELPVALAQRSEGSDKDSGLPELELQAELEMAGQPMVRVRFVGKGAAEKSHLDGAEKFAVANQGSANAGFAGGEVPERKILSATSKQDKMPVGETGTAIARGRAAMSTAQHEVIASARPFGTVADGVALMGVTGEPRMSAPVAPAVIETETASFAERAVATVTGLADAQFSVSMQKAGRVQLRLKFGGEDLSVRIELRDGVVHTDFQSDSPALRSAIMQEWQHVAASAAGRSHTFLDPVFSTGASALAADAGAQGQSFQRSPNQSQEQAATPADSWFGRAAFSGRSVLGENFSPEPAVPRHPLQLPTSLRLSALA
jgi:hypothetical protein